LRLLRLFAVAKGEGDGSVASSPEATRCRSRLRAPKQPTARVASFLRGAKSTIVEEEEDDTRAEEATEEVNLVYKCI
jgi:hypothetical protein